MSKPQGIQSRCYLHTLGPKVGTIYILGALGIEMQIMEIKEALRTRAADSTGVAPCRCTVLLP